MQRKSSPQLDWTLLVARCNRRIAPSPPTSLGGLHHLEHEYSLAARVAQTLLGARFPLCRLAQDAPAIEPARPVARRREGLGEPTETSVPRKEHGAPALLSQRHGRCLQRKKLAGSRPTSLFRSFSSPSQRPSFSQSRSSHRRRAVLCRSGIDVEGSGRRATIARRHAALNLPVISCLPLLSPARAVGLFFS